MLSALEDKYGATSRRLAVCNSGYWILTPVGGDGYPTLGVRLRTLGSVTVTAGTFLRGRLWCFPTWRVRLVMKEAFLWDTRL